MSWIKVQTTLATDPAVASIGARLRLADVHVVGCLVAVWSWADSLTADGFVQHATAAQIDRLAGKKGFADAMSAVGWLRLDPAGVVFPKWDRHNGASGKARAGEAESKRLSRAGIRRTMGPVSMSESGQMSGQKTDNVLTRGEERREEYRIPPAAQGVQGEPPATPSPPAVPPAELTLESLETATTPAKAPRAPQLADADWLASLKSSPAYVGIDVDREHAKAAEWCRLRRKPLTRQRFLNWLNRCDRPLGGSSAIMR